MCGLLPPRPEQVALNAWIWSARWQLTRFAQDHYKRSGRGITVLRTRTVPAVPPGVETTIPLRKLTYYTPDAIRLLKRRSAVAIGICRLLESTKSGRYAKVVRKASCHVWTHPKGDEAPLTVDGEWQRAEALSDGLALGGRR